MSKGTRDLLENVGRNLFRHTENKKYYGVKKIAGKKIFHYLETTDRRYAERQLEKWLAETGSLNPDRAKMTLGEVVAQFERERAGMSKGSRDGDTMVIKQMKETVLPDGKKVFDFDARFDRITPSVLLTFMAQMGKREITPRTYNYHAFVLGKICAIAHRDQLTPDNIYKTAKIRWKKLTRRVPTLPTLEQFEAIVTAIRTNRRKTDKAKDSGNFVEFLGRAGLGQAEAWNIFGRDIDFKKGEMKIRRVKTNTYFIVPIYPRLRPLLARMAKDAGGEFPPDERVFKVKDAKKAINGAIARLNKKGAKLPHFSQRNFRQMAIKNLVRAGVDVQLIAEWQAHRDGGKLIMDTYSQGFDSGDAAYRRQQLSLVA